MLAINISTPNSIMEEIRDKFRHKRLSLNLTQEGLSSKSGVSLGSVKRFETSGQISFESLLKIALVLDCLDDFKNIASNNDKQYESMEDLLKIKPIKKRGVIK